MQITNPANNESIAKINTDSPQSILEKFNLAKSAYPLWKNAGLKHRLECIEKFSGLLRDNIDELAKTLTMEMGKPLQESNNEIKGAVKKIKFFLQESQRILAPTQVNVDGNTQEEISYDPLGVIVNISAWNYPYLVGVNIFIPALICGNCVLYKPSELTSLTGQKIEQLMHQAGVPKHVFIAAYGKGEVGRELLGLPINGAYFTGSYNTGKLIHQGLAGRMIPMILELGGKDPLYVTEDISDLDQVAAAVTEGCFYNNGQSCCSVERVYVHEKIYPKFIQLMQKHTQALKVGDPMDASNQQGALARPEHLKFLQGQLADAIGKGGKILCGGHALPGPGAFFPPTLIENANHNMQLMQQETFGPLKGVMQVSGDEEAIKLMNDTEYGLTAAVYCQNTQRAQEILAQVNSGTSYINCCDRVSGYLPWSGRRHSGMGSSLSHLGLYAFCAPRGVHLRPM